MSQEKRYGDNQDSRTAYPGKVIENPRSASRKIGTSTSELLRNAFMTPSADSVAGSLASLSSQSSKEAPITGSSGFGEACSSKYNLRFPEYRDTPSTAPMGDGFRSTQRDGVGGMGTAQSAFDAFIAEPQELLVLTGTIQTAFLKGKQLATPSRSDDEDGAAVVALLSDPAFSVNFGPVGDWDCGSEEYTGADRITIKGHTHPYPVGSSYTPDVVNPLDLIPDFQHHPESHVPSDFIQGHGDIQSWLEILNRYHDEVWGDMLPLVIEFREELRVASARKEGAMQDRPAIRRLRTLLGHFEIPLS